MFNACSACSRKMLRSLPFSISDFGLWVDGAKPRPSNSNGQMDELDRLREVSFQILDVQTSGIPALGCRARTCNEGGGACRCEPIDARGARGAEEGPR